MPSRDSEKQPQILRLRAAARRFAQDDRTLLLQRPVKSLRKKFEEKANRLERPLLGEGHIPPAGIQPEAAARIAGHLHRHGPLHLIVGRRTHREHIVRANVGHHELVVRDEPDPVDTCRQALTPDPDRDLGYEVGLVLAATSLA